MYADYTHSGEKTPGEIGEEMGHGVLRHSRYRVRKGDRQPAINKASKKFKNAGIPSQTAKNAKTVL